MDDLYTKMLDAAGYSPPQPLNEAPPAEADEDGRKLYAKMLVAGGRPEWNDERIPAGDRIADFAKVHANAQDISGGETRRVFGTGYQYNAAAEDKAHADFLQAAKQQFPDVSPDAVAQKFQLERAHARQAKEGEGPVEYVARNVMPLRSIGNANRTDQYRRAVQAFQSGDATPDQMDVIARYERLNQIQANDGALASTARSLAGVPGMLAEGYAGGAAVKGLGLLRPGLAAGTARLGVQTAAMPSIYLEQGAQNQLANPKDNAFQSYTPAFGLGMVQTAVLGQLSGGAKGIGARTGLSLAEMQGADVAATGIDRVAKDVTGKSLGLDTKWGTLGSLVRDDPDAWKHAFVQVVTFAAFAAAHRGESPPPVEEPGKDLARVPPERAQVRPSDEVMNSWTDMLNHMQENGYTKETATQVTKDIFTKFDGLFKRNPKAGPAEARDLFKDMPDGPIRDFAEKLADQLPTPTTGEAQPGVRELPGRAKMLPERRVPALTATELPKMAPPDVPAETQPAVLPSGERPAEAKIDPGEPKFAHGPLPDVLAKAFPDAKVEDLGAEGLVVGRGDRFLHLKYDPATKRAEVNFGFNEWRQNEGIDLGRSLSKGSLDLGRDLTHVARSLKDAGVGVQFDAEPKRAAAFGRVLERAGFKLASATGDGQTRHLAFDPAPAKRSLKERIEASRGKVLPAEGVSVEIPGAKRVPEVAAPVSPEVAFDAAATKAGLSVREAHVLREGRAGRTLESIAGDPVMAKPKGGTYERERIRQIGAAAREKLRVAGVELPWFNAEQSVAKNVAAEALTRKVEAHSRGQLVSIEELQHDPKEVASKGRDEFAKQESHENAIDKLLTRIEKETKDAESEGRSISPERWAELAAEHDRLAAAVEGRGAPAESPAGKARPPRGVTVRPQEAKPVADVKLLTARIKEAFRQLEKDPFSVSPADAKTLGEQLNALPRAEGRAIAETKWGIPLKKKETPGDMLVSDLTATRRQIESQEDDGTIIPAHLPSKYDVLGFDPAKGVVPNEKAIAQHIQARAEFDAEMKAIHDRQNAQWASRFGDGPKGRSGKIVLPSWEDLKKSNVGRGLRVAADEWYKLRGGQFPRMDALSKPVADRAAALISAPAFAHAAVRFLKKAVYGDMTKEEAAKFYTTHAEMRLEYMRRSGKPNAGTLIGPDSPIKTHAEYAAIVRKPEFKAYLDRWKQHVVPIMNEHYWDAMGLPHGTPIPTTTQIPGIPINFSRVDPANPSASAVGSGGKTVKPEAVTQTRFGMNKAATGEHQYETDPFKALENIFRKGAEAAGRANLDRQIVADGVGKWGVAGQPIPTLPDGTPMKMVRHVDPEPGTQVAPPRTKNLFIHPDALGEYHDAIGVGNNFHIPLLTPTLQGFTKVAIMSTVEAAYHSATLAGKMLQPHMVRSMAREMATSLKEMLKDPLLTVKRLWRGETVHLSEGQLERLMGMAKGGESKDRGFESGFLVPEKLLEKMPWLGKLDPTRWGSAFLDTVDNMVRLSADRAFRLMRYKGLVEDTAQNKRDFQNDVGNYKTKSQAMLVRILRGTGIGPFATAATSSVANAIRSLWLSPGVTAISPLAQARLRLHVGLKLAAAAGVAALYNWLVWGKTEGDEHTPFGAIKTGEKDGRTYYVDPLRELRVRRGLNATGISAAIEDEKLGVSQRARIHDIGMAGQHTLLHPAAGPAVQFGKIQFTGHNMMGQRVAGAPEDNGSVEWENFKAGVKNVNPSLAALMGADKAGIHEKKPLIPQGFRDNPLASVGQAVEEGGPKLAAPYLMSRKQLGPETLKILKEKEAAPHTEIEVKEPKKLQPVLKK